MSRVGRDGAELGPLEKFGVAKLNN